MDHTTNTNSMKKANVQEMFMLSSWKLLKIDKFDDTSIEDDMKKKLVICKPWTRVLISYLIQTTSALHDLEIHIPAPTTGFLNTFQNEIYLSCKSYFL